ncbi:ABC transporter ATP-binding protein [Rhodococcus sp. NPDC019627]|uniref:ABC transporter ATP-binding protein n=1 Tax=unclassified Rhodococcus (in: high G+C Gram-positive bacteria) TaxID=192944 RepID=UPI00340D012C
MNSRLECHKVTARHGPLEVVHGVDLDILRGRVTVVTGPNGAGKTSLLRRIAGALPGDGAILLDGNHVGNVPSHRRVRAGIVTVPDTRGLFGELTVAENLELVTTLLPKRRRREALRFAEEAFPVLFQRADAPAGALSGGEQQMVAMARSLILEPAVLLLDEPSSGLAPRIVDEIGEVIGDLRERGVGVLLVEQNLVLANAVADSVAVMIAGEIALRGDGTSLLDPETLADAYLGGEDQMGKINNAQMEN